MNFYYLLKLYWFFHYVYVIIQTSSYQYIRNVFKCYDLYFITKYVESMVRMKVNNLIFDQEVPTYQFRFFLVSYYSFGTIQVLRQQKGGWVGSENGNFCWFTVLFMLKWVGLKNAKNMLEWSVGKMLMWAKIRIKGRKDTFQHFLDKKVDILLYFCNKNHAKNILVVAGWGQKRPKTCWCNIWMVPTAFLSLLKVAWFSSWLPY